MGKHLSDYQIRQNDKTLREAVVKCGGEATINQLRKRLLYSDEATLLDAVAGATRRGDYVMAGGKGLVAR